MTIGIHMKRRLKLRPPPDLIMPVRIPRMYHLAERVVKRLDENQQLGGAEPIYFLPKESNGCFLCVWCLS